MTEPRRRLQPLRLDHPPAPRPPTTPPAASFSNEHPLRVAGTPTLPSRSRTPTVLVLVIGLVTGGVLLVAGVTGWLALARPDEGPSGPPQAQPPSSPPPPRAEPTNDGSDPLRPVLPAADNGFVDGRGGWDWSNRCFINIKARKWGWAKAECDRAMAQGPTSPEPRAQVLYNEGLIATAAGDVNGARADYIESLALREHPTVRAALQALPAR